METRKIVFLAGAVLVGGLWLFSPKQDSSRSEEPPLPKYLTSVADCEKALADFRMRIEFFKTPNATAERLEAIAEELELQSQHYPAGHTARMEDRLRKFGCEEHPVGKFPALL